VTEILQLEADVIVQAVQFFDTYCEIVYTQKIDINSTSGEMITSRMTVDYANLDDSEIEDVFDTIRQWVDGTYRRLRTSD
jgi:hypothetical protein